MSSRILVVDDIEANRRLLQAKLEANYNVVMLAENGYSALELAEREQPDIILLDVMMPGMDGYETCRRLKQGPRTAHIPVVMVTALSDIEDRVKGLECGAEDFLTKPVSDFALDSRIAALSRYNTVASELRQRQASGVAAGALDDNETTELARPARVFVVDESPRASKRCAAILRAAGHKVSTLLEAGDMGDLASGGVDILLLSLSGQSFDALRICAHFRMRESMRAISIILAAEPHDHKRAAQGLELGASDIIQVPVDPQELLARVRTQARRARYIEIMRQRVDRGLELSVIDQLTGLYNRRYMTKQLSQWMQRSLVGATPLSVVALDIDHFKQVNDEWGHSAGDDVLREVAHRLQANVRPMDIVCRPGGEEFLVIMPETPVQMACAAAERVRLSVASEPFDVSQVPRRLDITLSAGVSTLHDGSDTPADLMGRADKALYDAKRSGRNRVVSLAA